MSVFATTSTQDPWAEFRRLGFESLVLKVLEATKGRDVDLDFTWEPKADVLRVEVRRVVRGEQ